VHVSINQITIISELADKLKRFSPILFNLTNTSTSVGAEIL